MAQRQYVKWKDPLKSWVQNTSFLGLFNPGRYCGFDTATFPGALRVSLNHSGTGMVIVDPDDTPQNPYGILVTKQGSYIVEDEVVGPLTIVSNAGNSYVRYDAIIATHAYTTTPGDNPATYSILTGPFATPNSQPVPPVLPNPEHQILIGVLEIQPGFDGTDNSKVRYIPQNAPDTGDDRDAKLGRANTFTKTNQNKQYEVPINNPDNSSPNLGDGYWLLPKEGNTFLIYPSTDRTQNDPKWNLWGLKLQDLPQQNGTRIRLLINKRVRVVSENMGTTPMDYPFSTGYRPIYLPGRFSTGQNNQSKNTFETQPGIKTAYIELELINDVWVCIGSNQYRGENADIEKQPSISGLGIAISQLLPLSGSPNFNWNQDSGMVDPSYPLEFTLTDYIPTGFKGLTLPNRGSYATGFETKVYGIDFAKPFLGQNQGNNVEILRDGFIKITFKIALALKYDHISSNTDWRYSTLGALFMGFTITRSGSTKFHLGKFYPEVFTTAPVSPPLYPSPTFYYRNKVTLECSMMLKVQKGDILVSTVMASDVDASKPSNIKPKVYCWNPGENMNQVSMIYYGQYPEISTYDGIPQAQFNPIPFP